MAAAVAAVVVVSTVGEEAQRHLHADE